MLRFPFFIFLACYLLFLGHLFWAINLTPGSTAEESRLTALAPGHLEMPH